MPGTKAGLHERVARILYENKRSADNSYPLHQLVCATVDDALEIAGANAASLIDGIPRGGRDTLLRDCGERVQDMFAGLPRERRFALIDGDELHVALGLAGNSTLAERRAALAVRYPDVRTFVPDAPHPRSSNTEGLLLVAGECLSMAADDQTLTAAVGKHGGGRIARDRIFARMAWGPRGPRDCLLARQPSLQAMVTALVDIVGPHLKDRLDAP